MSNPGFVFTQYPGNAIPAPAFRNGAISVDDELLYSTKDYIQKGVTLEPGQGVLPLGTILGRVTATKRYKAYSAGANDGSQTPLGILRKTVDTGVDSSSNAQLWQANILYAGVLKLDRVQSANSGVSLTSVLGGQTNSVVGFFKF